MTNPLKLIVNFTIYKEDEGCPAIVHHLKVPCSLEHTGIHNHNNIADITKTWMQLMHQFKFPLGI